MNNICLFALITTKSQSDTPPSSCSIYSLIIYYIQTKIFHYSLILLKSKFESQYGNFNMPQLIIRAIVATRYFELSRLCFFFIKIISGESLG